MTETIKISELKPHPQNDYYFDDMTGDSWDSMIQSISTSGITNAITITKDKVIISGHQRVRGCKVLGIEEIEYKEINYTEEDLRNQKDVKDLIESNLRQRVVGNANPIKLGRCFIFLNNWYGIRNGSAGKVATTLDGNKFHPKSDKENLTQKDLADKYEIAQKTMNNYMRLAKSIPELEDLVSTGKVTPTTALSLMKQLTPEEQAELIASMDTTQKLTQKEVQKYIDQIKHLEETSADQQRTIAEQREQLSSIPEPKTVKEVVEVDKPETKLKLKELERQIKDLTAERDKYKEKTDLNQKQADRFKNLQRDIETLTKKKDGLSRGLNAVEDLAKLNLRIQDVLEKELAPIKYKRSIEAIDHIDVCTNNLIETVNRVDTWVKEMRKLLSDNKKLEYEVDADYIEINN